MTVRDWKCGLILLAAGMAMPLSTTACGDDDTGGEEAGKSGGGGKSGSGGKAGGGGAGGSVSPAMCESGTKTATQSSWPAACYKCLCTAAADITAVDKCNKNDKCWPLIACAGSMCAQGETVCILDKCKAFEPTGAPGTVATPVGMLLEGKCSDECAPASTDGGTNDAGN
jgi:hypothetical protein